MGRGRNSRSDDGTCPRTGDEKKREETGRYCLKIIFRFYCLFGSVYSRVKSKRREQIRLIEIDK